MARPWGLGNMILSAAALASYRHCRGNVIQLRISVLFLALFRPMGFVLDADSEQFGTMLDRSGEISKQ